MSARVDYSRATTGMDGMLPLAIDAPVLLHGDCLDLLATLPAESVDVVVTDLPAGVGFMGKPWDSFAGYQPRTERGRTIAARLGADAVLVEAASLLLGLSLSERTEGLPAREDAARLAAELRARCKVRPVLPPWAVGFVSFLVDVWSEVDRVLKPGGYVCSWALPKTADLAGLALRAVGWEVHDSVLHLFGSGMAKAGDLGKRIDAMLGAEREVVGKRVYAGGHVQNSHADRSEGVYGLAGGSSDDRMVTAPATPEAKRWTDWSSQLAPGHEQWLVARKPTPLTYAKQVLAHGCGAMNIGACRVPRGSAEARDKANGVGAGAGKKNMFGCAGYVAPAHPDGSWPKNVILTEGGEGCPVAEIDRQSGTQNAKPGRTAKRGGSPAFGKEGLGSPDEIGTWPADAGGGASRYFTRIRYTAKNSDRRAGLRQDIDNDHATPKSVDLMRWLVRLLAAKAEHTGGAPAIVLDPFMGSGSTGVACVAEQVRFIGIERDPMPDAPPKSVQSFHIAKSRIMTAIGSPDDAAAANEVAPAGAQLGLL
jgi:DNA modification methylase